MVKKFVDPLVSLIVIGASVCFILFFIVGQQGALNDQLTASAIRYNDVKIGAGFGEKAISEVKENMEIIISEDCLINVEIEFEEKWNKECNDQGLEDKCSLPMKKAGQLIDEYEEARSQCI
jgi:cell division protein YceG involved in septum cleavage